MLGRCSLSLDLKEFDSEIERTLTKIIAKEKLIKEEMDGEQPAQQLTSEYSFTKCHYTI